MKKKLLFSACACMAVVLGLGCSEVNGVPSRAPSGYPEGPKTMVDAGATAITRTLYENLFVLAERGTMFGHQIPTLYGLDNNRKWWAGDDTDLSDTKYLTGSHPAVCGWELSNIELDMETNIDGELFTEVRKHIIAAFGRGAVNTISWHCANPVSGGNSWDGTRAVYSIIPGGENHEKFKGWLDKVADFMLSLKSPEGEPIPLIFRPWHEHTGSWFWWGQNLCSTEDYKALWRMTYERMQEKGATQLLYAYSPGTEPKDSVEYLERYPGDDIIDLIGVDAYQFDKDTYVKSLDNALTIMSQVSKAHKKVMAVTETGYETIPDSVWWTQTLMPVIEKYPISYVLVWRNARERENHYYAPYPGHPSADDFLNFYNDSRTLFAGDMKNVK